MPRSDPSLEQGRAGGILRYLGKANAEPVVHGWGRDLSDMDPAAEGLVVDTLLPDEADKAS